jgi:hypothetical protein
MRELEAPVGVEEQLGARLRLGIAAPEDAHAIPHRQRCRMTQYQINMQAPVRQAALFPSPQISEVMGDTLLLQ